MESANFGWVIQVPYVDDIGVNHVYAGLEWLTSKVATRPQVAPVF